MYNIIEKTKPDITFLVDQLREEIEIYFEQGESNSKLIKRMNTSVLENFQVLLKEYSKILNAELDDGLTNVNCESIESKVNIKIEKFNSSNKAATIGGDILVAGVISSILVKLYVEGALIYTILLPLVAGAVVGFASYKYINKKERIKLKKNIDSYFDNLEKLLESYTIEYCKVYEKKRNMLI